MRGSLFQCVNKYALGPSEPLSCSRLGLFADIGQYAAIDVKHMAVDSIRGMRGQEYCGSAQLFRLQPAPGRRLGTDERVEGMATAVWLPFAQWGCLRCGDVARADAVALDVILTIL